MTDDEVLDHLAKLAEDRWREYDSKSQAEWKLSYGIWGALLAATAALLARPELIHGASLCVRILTVVLSGLLAFAALAIHGGFLFWAHSRLGELRREMDDILRKRTELLGLERGDRKNIGGASALVQLVITVLLGTLLVGVATLASL